MSLRPRRPLPRPRTIPAKPAAEKPQPKPHPNTTVVPEGQRPCPVCKTLMAQDTKHGVTVDLCAMHGIWFDRDEFEALFAYMKSNERLHAQRMAERTVAVRARREGLREGALRGWWALLE